MQPSRHEDLGALVACSRAKRVAGSRVGIRRCLPRLVGQLKPNRPTSLLLAYDRAIRSVTTRRHIIDADGDHVAAAQFADWDAVAASRRRACLYSKASGMSACQLCMLVPFPWFVSLFRETNKHAPARAEALIRCPVSA